MPVGFNVEHDERVRRMGAYRGRLGEQTTIGVRACVGCGEEFGCSRASVKRAESAGPGQLGEKRVDAYECVLSSNRTRVSAGARSDRIRAQHAAALQKMHHDAVL